MQAEREVSFSDSEFDILLWLKQQTTTQVTIHAHVLMVLTALKRKQLVGSYPCAKATIEIYKSLIGQCKFANVAQLIRAIKQLGITFCRVAPAELVIGNVVRRIIYMIREEYAPKYLTKTGVGGCTPEERGERRPRGDTLGSTGSIGSMDSSGGGAGGVARIVDALSRMDMVGDASSMAPKSCGDTDYTVLVGDLRSSIMSGLGELEDELENVYDPITDVALDHIHQGETVLAFGDSVFVSRFLKAAARKRQFHVLVAEGEPSLSGQKLAQNLSSNANIGVTLVPDSNVFALMSRVNKVVFSPLAVTAEGGAICTAGHAMIVQAAKLMAVHVIGLAASFMITPLPGAEQTSILKQLHSPASFVGYDQPAAIDLNVELHVPVSDYVPPEHIDIYLTNNGCHLPPSIQVSTSSAPPSPPDSVTTALTS